MTDTEVVARIETLSVAISPSRGGGYALQDLDLEVRRGQAIGLVGESGSGKSMAAKAMLGLLPPGVAVTSGRVEITGHDVGRMSERERTAFRAQHLGYVPQDPLQALNPVLSVGNQITEAQRLGSGPAGVRRLIGEIMRGYGVSLSHRQERESATALLAQAKITHPEHRVRQYPHEFSGGMRQRAIIAASLARKPALLIADEPTTALDASVERHVLQLLSDLRRDAGTTLVLISHDLNVIAEICDYVYVLYGGRLLERGPTKVILNHPRSPYTDSLLAATPSFDKPMTVSMIERGESEQAQVRHGCPFAPRCPRVLDICRSEFPATGQAREQSHHFWCHNPVTPDD